MPFNFISYMGCNRNGNGRRDEFLHHLNDEIWPLIKKSMNVMVDEIVDDIAVDFIQHRLPPPPLQRDGCVLDINSDADVCLTSLNYFRVQNDEGNEDIAENGVLWEMNKIMMFLMENENIEHFCIFYCSENKINEHCVRFIDEDEDVECNYAIFPFYLRSVLEILMETFPKMISMMEFKVEMNDEINIPMNILVKFVRELFKLNLITVGKK